MANNVSRRSLMIASGAAVMLAALPAQALTTAQAKSLIDQVVTRIKSAINSGKAEDAMYRDFEKILAEYGDMNFIASQTLGPPARAASAAQMRGYKQAFQTYMSRKYGKRFREFIGGTIDVRDAKAVKSYYQVNTIANLRGTPPFQVDFFVSDKSGSSKFFDMRIEGISVIKIEREEIGGLLDQRRGNLDRLIADLPNLG